MKKSFKKTLVMTLVLLLAGVMSLTTVTYAWFTTGNEASITQVDLEVTSVDGLLIAAKPEAAAFKSQLALSDLQGATNEGNKVATTDLQLSPVSTTSTVTSGALSFFSAEINPADSSQIKTAAATSGWVQFNLYVYNPSSADKNLCFKNTSGSTNIAFTTGSGTTKNAEYATRMALVTHGSDSYTTLTTGTPTFAAGTAALIYENNKTTHIQEGLIREGYIKGSATAAENNVAYEYKGVSKASSTYFHAWSDTTNLAAVTTKDKPEDLAFTVGAGKVVKLTFYAWIEGQDSDCLNAIAGDKVSLKVFIGNAAQAS